MLSRDKMPLYMVLSVLAALAVGMIVYRFSQDESLAWLVGAFLVISDYLALRWLLDKNNDDRS